MSVVDLSRIQGFRLIKVLSEAVRILARILLKILARIILMILARILA
jgi:hypothetical protein